MHDQATVELRHAGPFPSPGFALRVCLGKSWAGNGKEKVNHEIARSCVNMLDESDFTLANLH